jgi:hypothetical protein
MLVDPGIGPFFQLQAGNTLFRAGFSLTPGLLIWYIWIREVCDFGLSGREIRCNFPKRSDPARQITTIATERAQFGNGIFALYNLQSYFGRKEVASNSETRDEGRNVYRPLSFRASAYGRSEISYQFSVETRRIET